MLPNKSRPKQLHHVFMRQGSYSHLHTHKLKGLGYQRWMSFSEKRDMPCLVSHSACVNRGYMCCEISKKIVGQFPKESKETSYVKSKCGLFPVLRARVSRVRWSWAVAWAGLRRLFAGIIRVFSGLMQRVNCAVD